MSGSVIRVLHISDLHAGQPEGKRYFSNFKREFYEDVLAMQDDGPPIDAIIFTGDLSWKGAKEEFREVDEVIKELAERIGVKTKKPPIVLAVPGNHDLSRPPPLDGNQLALTTQWSSNEDLRREFWQEESSSYRRLVNDAFREYQEWWGRTVDQARNLRFTQGILPGDYSVTFSTNGILLGIVGLNSAFLQLNSKVAQGGVALDLAQLRAACPKEINDWVEGHHATLLLTHHPPEWLNAPSLSEFNGELAPPGRFTAHLFGHMHESKTEFRRTMGSKTTRQVQAPSMFGAENYGNKLERRHGYILLDIGVDASEEHGRIHLRPRDAEKVNDRFRLGESRRFEFQNKAKGIIEEVFDVSVRRSPKSRPPDSTPARTPEIDPPGGPFSVRWYVERPRLEEEAMEFLIRRGRPAVLVAQRYFGRTWMIGRLLHRWNSLYPGLNSVRVNFRSFGGEAIGSMDRLVYQVAESICSELNIDEEVLDEIDPGRPQRASPMKRLRNFLVRHVLKDRPAPLLVALDDLDCIAVKSYRGDFYGGLRAWMEEETDAPIHNLRLLLSVSVEPAQLIDGDGARSIWNLAIPIRIGPLSVDEVSVLAERYGLPLKRPVIEAIHLSTGGAPVRVAEVLYRMAKS